MRIKFLVDYTPKAAGNETFKKDQVCDLSDASADHFIRRSLAVPVIVPESMAAPPEKMEADDVEGVNKPRRGRPPSNKG